jgi:hypothetical protein
VVPESFLKNSKVVSLRAMVKGEDQRRGSRGSGGGEGGGKGEGEGESKGEGGEGDGEMWGGGKREW